MDNIKYISMEYLPNSNLTSFRVEYINGSCSIYQNINDMRVSEKLYLATSTRTHNSIQFGIYTTIFSKGGNHNGTHR